MEKFQKFWHWLRDEHNREASKVVLAFSTAIVVGAWALFQYFEPLKIMQNSIDRDLQFSFSGSLSETQPNAIHHFEIPEKIIIAIDPQHLDDDSLYFDLEVTNNTGTMKCKIPRWKGSSGITNGMLVPIQKPGKYMLQISVRDNTSGPYRIKINPIKDYNIEHCTQRASVLQTG